MFDHPLRLAIGSHQAGSGKGCAMNVISFENGDSEITDLPDCSDRMLARLVSRSTASPMTSAPPSSLNSIVGARHD